MSIQASIEIQEKEAALRRSPLQKFAAAAPLLFLLLFVFGSGNLLFSGHSERRLDELELYFFYLFVACVVLFVLQKRNQKKIARLEIDILKLKRKINESGNEN
jgi:cbb3-type cytochrome oxidase subunit 3